MTQDFQPPALSADRWHVSSPHSLWGWILIGALTLLVYHHVLTELVTTWSIDPDFSHGFLVAIFAGYLVWAKRKAFQNREADFSKTDFSQTYFSWSGVSIVALGLLIHILGVYGASVFLARISLVIVLTGLVHCFGGWPLVRELRLALLVLLLAIPLPAIIFNQIALPLQFLASKLASHLLPLFGVPVLREGNVIELASIKLEVAEACSGIRSLVSLFTLAVFYGYFLEKAFMRRLLLALSSIPIAIAANAVRIFGTGLCVEYWSPEKALGFFHKFSGWVMFVVSIGCLFIVHRIMLLALALRRQS